MQFGERLARAVRESVPCCVGIDPHMASLPRALSGVSQLREDLRVLTWCMGVLDAIKGIVPMVKPQSAFFEQWGPAGIEILQKTIAYAVEQGFIVLLDAKRGDIGSTAQGYITSGFEVLGADAVTLSPYLGPESLDPWRKYTTQHVGKGGFVLLRTSNPGALAWQGGPVRGSMANNVAEWLRTANEGYDLGPFGAVVGATIDADEMVLWRRTLPNTWFLLPGYGAQGAKAEDCKPAFRKDGLGVIVVSARDVLFPAGGRTEEDWRDGVAERATAFATDIKSMLATL